MAEGPSTSASENGAALATALTAPRMSRLLAFARELQRAATFQELVLITQAEVQAAVGYAHTWLFVADREGADEVRLIDFAGANRGLTWELAPVLKVKGDAMIEEIISSDEPVVVADARTDPRTDKRMVEQLGNRTIVNVQLRLLDAPFGALGVGTFHDEGCRPPTREQLDYLIGMASQVSVAAGRIRFLEERRVAAEQLKKSEERFLQAQKMEAVGRLAGSIAHDFNNLLTVILSYSTMLLDSPRSDEDTREDIEMIKGAGERAAELTKQLLAFSRQQVVSPRVVDLNAVIARSERLLRRLLPVDIQLVTQLDPALERVKLDPSQMDQVLVNLAVNARDAMPGGGTVTLETRNVDLNEGSAAEPMDLQPGPHVMVAVTDTGTGMTPETRAHLFEPFFTTKEQGKGTGLGLATVFGIVKQSGGAIAVRTELGVGTRFELYFPAVDSPQELTPLSDPRAIRSPLPGTDLTGSETLLLIDDQEEVRRAVKDMLIHYGYRVLEASTAEQALKLCRTHAGEIQLLVSDVIMPHMHGPELARRMLALRPALRVLFISGYTGTAAPDAPFTPASFLQKPIVPETLARRVRQLLDA